MKLAASLLVLATVGCAAAEKAPAFNMTELGGTKLSNSSLKGKVVLLDFWANWCGPCKKASPTMDGLYKTYKAKGLVVVGVNVWEGKATGKTFTDAQLKAMVAKYKADHKYSYPMTFGNSNDGIAKALGYGSIPQFLLIDKSGNIVWKASGIAKLTELPAAIEAALK